jgi:hypothetical protein
MDAAGTNRNLCVQGYALSPAQAHAVRFGLRFPTALCFVLVGSALALGSARFMVALVPIGALAGWSRRHPFDVLWNRLVRRVVGEPEVPPTPRRRRHAFKLATFCIAGLAGLLAADQHRIAVLVALPLLAVCALVTTTSRCLPSYALAWIEQRRGRRDAVSS